MTGQDVILGILAVEPKSGYDIKKKFEDLFSYFLMRATARFTPRLASWRRKD